MIPRNSSASSESEKWRLNKKERLINLKNLLCKRTLFRILYIVAAGIGISFHTSLENGIGRTYFDWTITPGCFISDIIISMVQIISILYGVKKDKLDRFYNAFLSIMYAISLNSLMNALTPEDYDTFAWYRIITESIASAVAFLLHFFEVISTWIESELGMEPYIMNQSRSLLHSSLHTRTGRMRISRFTQTEHFKECVSLHNYSPVDKSLNAIEVSNPTSQDGKTPSNHSIEDDSSWIRETVLVSMEQLFPRNNDEN